MSDDTERASECPDCLSQLVNRYEDGVSGPGTECMACGWFQDDDGLDHDPFRVGSKPSASATDQTTAGAADGC